MIDMIVLVIKYGRCRSWLLQSSDPLVFALLKKYGIGLCTTCRVDSTQSMTVFSNNDSLIDCMFRDVFLTTVGGKPRIKVLIGDKLAAHFTPNVIKATVKNDIVFVTLIPNATHLLQPLDVAVFRPAKIKWHAILESSRKEIRYKGMLPQRTTFQVC